MEVFTIQKLSEFVVSAIVTMGVEELCRQPVWQGIFGQLQGQKGFQKVIDEIKQNSQQEASSQLTTLLQESIEKYPQFALELSLLIGNNLDSQNYPILNTRDWVGREDAIQQIQNWLKTDGVRTIGIQGLGGVGKSYLVSYLCKNYQRCADEFRPIYFDFNRDDFKSFIEFTKKFTIKLGEKSLKIHDVEPTNKLFSYLQKFRILLVMDNLDNLLDESRRFQDKDYEVFLKQWIMQGSNSILLLTTREKPRILERERFWYLLEGLKPQESVQFLNQLGIGISSPELEDFVDYTDGNPLVLRLAAEYLRRNCHGILSNLSNLSLAKFQLVYQKAEGIHRNLDLTNLEAIITQHFDRLTKQQRNFLFNLSVYHQPFDYEMAGQMWNKEEELIGNRIIYIQEELSELVDRSLLIKTKDKYQSQLLVQRYILESSENLAFAHQLAINYYSQFCHSQPKTEVDVQPYLETYYHKFQLKEYDSAFDYLDKVNNLLAQYRHYNTQVEYYRQLVEAYESRGDIKNLNYAFSLLYIAPAYHNLGQYEKAADYNIKAVMTYRNIPELEIILDKLRKLFRELQYNPQSIYKTFLAYIRSIEISRELDEKDKKVISSTVLGEWFYSLVKSIQENKWRSILFFILAVIASPFALSWVIFLVLLGMAKKREQL